MELISTNPSNDFEPIGSVEITIKEEISETVKKAKIAQGKWAELTIQNRCDALISFIEVSNKRFEEIAKIISLETGRPISSSRGNVSGGISYLQTYIEIAQENLSPRATFETDSEIHKAYMEPYGVIAVIAPWNYPFLNIAFQCGQALLAGNTIVFKNSEENPLFAKLIAELISESQLPENVFNVIYGDGEVGQALVNDEIDMISFTGSTKTGLELTKLAAEKFIPIITELGGSSPGIIFEDANLEESVIELIYGLRFWNSGQSCDALKRLLVHESIFEETVKQLVRIVANKKVGNALDEDSDIGPLISQKQLQTLETQVQDALDKGAVIRSDVTNGTSELKGAYFQPTILTNISKDMKVWSEEVFGPVLPVVSFKDEEEAIELANDTEYGLGAFVFTQDKEKYLRVARKLDTSMIAHNKVMYWNPRNPFGGYKKSGMGRTHGEFGFKEVTQIKLISQEK